MELSSLALTGALLAGVLLGWQFQTLAIISVASQVCSLVSTKALVDKLNFSFADTFSGLCKSFSELCKLRTPEELAESDFIKAGKERLLQV